MFFKDFVSVKRQKIKRGASQTYDTPSYRGRRRFELTKIRLDDEKFFLPVFDEQRSCYKICWSDFVTLTEGVQVTKMQIKEDVV